MRRVEEEQTFLVGFEGNNNCKCQKIHFLEGFEGNNYNKCQENTFPLVIYQLSGLPESERGNKKGKKKGVLIEKFLGN